MAIIRQDSLSTQAHMPVIIVGAGACGMTAALAASDGGAAVMVLEREAVPSGTTGMSQGFICAAGTQQQREAGIEDSADRFYDDIMAKTRGETDPAMARVVAENAGPTVDWLTQRHAIPLTVEPAWRGDFGHTRPRLHGVPARHGSELLGSLVRAAEQAGVTLVTGARVTDVFADHSDRVLGVRVARPDGSIEEIGCDALVLATCGFANNRAMLRDYIPGSAEGPIWAPEGADGSGIGFGMGLGGAVADMGAFQGYGALNTEAGILVNYNMVMEGGIQVNTLGERFCNELADISAQGLVVLGQPGGIAWMVYDEQRHERAKAWFEYKQLLSVNMVRSAPDAAGLAALIGVPEAALVQTIAAVQGMAGGAADPFGRDFAKHAPLKGPFYSAKCTGALFHTQGGLVVDANAQVKREDGSLLPNLFAGGGTARSISGPGVWGYLPAAGLCMAVTLGRLAGEAAARTVLAGADLAPSAA